MEVKIISTNKNIKKPNCENEYKKKIESFALENGYNFFDNKVIKYAVGLKNDIISSLENNSSETDEAKVGDIKWIEKFIDETHEYLIEKKMKVSTLIKKQKTFVYISNKELIARHLGKRNILSRRKWIWIRDQYHYFKNKRLARTHEDYARLIRTELFKNKPEFWEGSIYETQTIINILEKQKW